MIPVAEYTSIDEMHAAAKARRATFYARQPEPQRPAPPPSPKRVSITERQRAEIEEVFRVWLCTTPPKAEQPWKVICKVVSKATDIAFADLIGDSRVARYSHARQMACWLLRKHTAMSFPVIGRRLGRDHTTILHACRKVQSAYERDVVVAELLDGLSSEIVKKLGLDTEGAA